MMFRQNSLNNQAGTMENNTPLELYIHIPFCVKKCLYCDFLSFAADEVTRKKYVEQLIKEIETCGTRITGRDADAAFPFRSTGSYEPDR